MKIRNFAISVTVLLIFADAYADDSIVVTSKSVGKAPTLSKEEISRSVEDGSICTDAKGLANSRGAVIAQDGRFYRCVKSFGEIFSENKKLVWVEVTLKDGIITLAD